MIFFQIKAIRKGEKPPIWRRAYVPSGITFAQMACILNQILETPSSHYYEFEFYQKKDRIIEWSKEDQNLKDYYYTYLNAPDTFVDQWMMNEKWFNFRLRKNFDNALDYRVEIEKRLKQVQVTGEDKPIEYPLIVKEVNKPDDLFWSDPHAINQVLKEQFFLKEAKPRYQLLSEIQEQMKKEPGMEFCNKPVNRDIHTIRSIDSSLKDYVDNMLTPVFERKFDEMKEQIKIDPETGELVTPIEEANRIAEAYFNEMLAEIEQKTKEQKSGNAGIIGGTEEAAPFKSSLKSFLQVFNVKELKLVAEQAGFQLKAKQKKGMAEELADYLLLPNTMRELLIPAEEENLDTFEAVMEKGKFVPTDEEQEKLALFHTFGYVVTFKDNKIEVPEDVKAVYSILQEEDYRRFHKKAAWLQKCLMCFELVHLVGPVKVLYRMYKQRKELDAGYEEFRTVLKAIPERFCPNVLRGDLMISKAALENDAYKRLMEKQRQIPYYIPTEEEIVSYFKHRYPACSPEYQKLWRFFHDTMHREEEDCDSYCQDAFEMFSSGDMVFDYMDMLNEENLVFPTEEAVRDFAPIVMEASNSTHMFELRGHTPSELSERLPAVSAKGHATSIAPLSTNAATMLEANRSELLSKGFTLDLESTGVSFPADSFSKGASEKVETKIKKVYPNDPCPCGSGKKYKKCCGRNK